MKPNGLGPMSDSASFEDPATLKQFIAEQLVLGRVAVILGAGASIGFGLPNWNELTNRLYAAAKVPRKGLSPADEADALLLEVYGEDDLRFSHAVRDVLYASFDASIKSLQQNLLLSAIAGLTISNLYAAPTRMISFNYDNLLERFLKYHGFYVVSVTDLPTWRNTAQVSVFHPHGFLPFEDGERIGPVVYADIHYDRIVNNPGLWREQLFDILRSNTCLFIGLSGDDRNLKALLENTKNTHVSKTHRHPYWAVTFSDREETRSKWELRGVWQATLGSYNELPDWLFDICRLTSDLRGPS